jgi:hypothetical protein
MTPFSSYFTCYLPYVTGGRVRSEPEGQLITNPANPHPTWTFLRPMKKISCQISSKSVILKKY